MHKKYDVVEMTDDLKSNFRSWERDSDNEEDAERLTHILIDRYPEVDPEAIRQTAYDWVGYEDVVENKKHLIIGIQSFEDFNEEKKWIKDAIKKPGSLRKSMKKKKDEKITKSDINSELKKLKSKDKDKKKPGIQGLNKDDLKKFRRLNLAKTLSGMKKENKELDIISFKEFIKS